jgi:peptidoglycan-associated lipoprotein
MTNQRLFTLAVSMVMPAILIAGCTKPLATADVFGPPPAATPEPPSSPGAPTSDRPVTSLGDIVTRPGTAPFGTPAPSETLAPSSASTPSGPLPAGRPAPAEFTASPELAAIHFDFDRYDIRPGDAAILEANAAWLRANTGTRVLIEGNCDERGTDAYNLALGDRRAKAAMDYLVSRGIQAERITTLSYGKERPLCREHTEACWAKNRRADFGAKAR